MAGEGEASVIIISQSISLALEIIKDRVRQTQEQRAHEQKQDIKQSLEDNDQEKQFMEANPSYPNDQTVLLDKALPSEYLREKGIEVVGYPSKRGNYKIVCLSDTEEHKLPERWLQQKPDGCKHVDKSLKFAYFDSRKSVEHTLKEHGIEKEKHKTHDRNNKEQSQDEHRSNPESKQQRQALSNQMQPAWSDQMHEHEYEGTSRTHDMPFNPR